MPTLSDAASTRWIDHKSYFGPDRRLRPALRVRERRKLDISSSPPPLSRALRNLKHRVLDARGHKGVGDFADIVINTAILADLYDQPAIRESLSTLARRLYAHRGEDMRPMIYASLDRLHCVSENIH